jgi:hypothetical protein
VELLGEGEGEGDGRGEGEGWEWVGRFSPAEVGAQVEVSLVDEEGSAEEESERWDGYGMIRIG